MPAQPEPILFPRKALDQRFAVLLLNSMYDAVDSLDFIPMVRPHTWRTSLCNTRGCSAKQAGVSTAKSALDDYAEIGLLVMHVWLQQASVASVLSKSNNVHICTG